MKKRKASSSSRASKIVALIDFGPPFFGEMVCAKCYAAVNGDGTKDLDWRCFDVHKQRFYCCPKCHGGAGSSVTEECQAWMILFFQEFIKPDLLRKKITNVLYWRQTDGLPVCEKIQG